MLSKILPLTLDYDRIIKNIEKGEGRISRKDEIMKAIGKKLDRYRNPWLELKIQYGQNKGKLYNEECDRFMVWYLFNPLYLYSVWVKILDDIDPRNLWLTGIHGP